MEYEKEKNKQELLLVVGRKVSMFKYYHQNKAKIQYTLAHRKVFRKVEKELLGKNTISGLLHDLDKVILCCFLPYPTVKHLHLNIARHHFYETDSVKDFKQMIIDWECARYTKPDKPLNARETLYAYYPQLVDKIEPILKELNL